MPITIRNALDTAYRTAGYFAAVFLVLILFLVALQMVARWVGLNVAGASDITGYSMAAASFLAFPYSLNNGSHIRVSLLLNAAGRFRWYVELWCWALASVFASLFAWYAVKLTFESQKWNEISGGQDAWPLWIPQTAMAIGTVLFAICAIDNLITHFRTGEDNIKPTGVDMQSE